MRWLAVLWLVVGCGGSTSVRGPASPADADRLVAIRIEGNRAIASSVLVPALGMQHDVDDGRPIDPYLVTQDTNRIRAAYLRRGFFEVTVTPRIDRPADREQVMVFVIGEGRRATASVQITGLPPDVDAAAARALVGLRDGGPFDYDAYDAAKAPLLALLENAGYARVTLQAKVDADPVDAIARVQYAIAAGPRCTFGAIHYPSTMRPELIDAATGRITFARGDRYSRTALEASQAALYDLGRFSAVRLAPEAGSAVVDVAFDGSEATRREVHAGFGIGLEPETYEARVRGGGSYVPEGHPLLALALDGRLALTTPHSFDLDQLEPKVKLLATLQRLDLLRPMLRGDVEAGVDYQTVEAYTWKGGHARFGLSSPLGAPWLQGAASWQLEYLAFDSVSPAIDAATAHALRLDRDQRRGTFSESVIADLRDDKIEPHDGGYLELRFVEGSPVLGGDLTYFELLPELRVYMSLGKTVLAARARYAAIFGDVPVTERFYGGGAAGQRGFSERRLSPTAMATADGKVVSVVIGGAGQIDTSVELRQPIGTLWIPIGLDVFLDGGDVTLTPGELDPWHLHWAAGAGLWGKLGGIKIRVDAGYRLNRTGPGEPSPDAGTFAYLAGHLGIGETF